MSEATSISRPPTRRELVTDRVFRGLTYVFAWGTVLLVLWIVLEIGGSALPAIKQHGLSFLTGTTWDANKGEYAIRPHIWGTLYSSALALVIATILGVAVAVFLSERFLSAVVFQILKAFGLQSKPFWARLPDRARGRAQEPGRAVGGHSERGLRTVGAGGHHSADPAGLQLAARPLGRDSAVRHLAVWAGHAAGRAGAGDHDLADHLGDQPRCPGERAPQAPRGGLRPGGHQVGGDSGGHHPHGADRHFRLGAAGLRPRWARPWPWPCWSAMRT